MRDASSSSPAGVDRPGLETLAPRPTRVSAENFGRRSPSQKQERGALILCALLLGRVGVGARHTLSGMEGLARRPRDEAPSLWGGVATYPSFPRCCFGACREEPGPR
jgi:hypothetical protein